MPDFPRRSIGSSVGISARRTPRATIIFRSGWEWLAVEGDAALAGPHEELNGPAASALQFVRAVYAAAAGGTPEQWASLDQRFVDEAHTAVLVTPTRVYPSNLDEHAAPLLG